MTSAQGSALHRTSTPPKPYPTPRQPVFRQARHDDPVPLHSVLNVTLANTFDLKARVVQARWQARQSGDGQLADIYDDFNDELDFWADLIGQRSAMLGGLPRAFVDDITRLSRLPPPPGALVFDMQLRNAVTEGIDVTRQYLQGALQLAQAENDASTVDVLQRLRRRLDNKKDVLAPPCRSTTPSSAA